MGAKKKTSEKKIIIRIVLAVFLVLLIAAGIKVYEDVLADNVEPEAENGLLFYYTNVSFDENFERIRKQHVLRNTDALKRLIKLAGYETMLKPGRYRLSGTDRLGTSNLGLMRMLVSGRQEPVDVVFKYAERRHDLAAFWGTQLEADSTAIEKLLYSSLISDSLGLDLNNNVLCFVPNTYNFYWNTSAPQLIQRMIEEYRKFWDSTRLEKAMNLHLTVAQVGTLAAIVQKETYRNAEMPVVAGVYYNRLNRGMPLQADPTILFAVNDKSIRRVAGAMLKIESPYNTYVYKGLPPGPICIPSAAAIDAVLNLQRHNYIYFCAKEDFSGYHNFAASFAQHQVNARKYQQALNRRGIK